MMSGHGQGRPRAPGGGGRPQEPRVVQYFVDREGEWWSDGWPVDDHELRDELSRSLFAEGGRLFIRCDGEIHPVAVEIAPLFVRDVDERRDASGALVAIEIHLHDGRSETLRPQTLAVDERDRLFCEATPARLRALFTRPAFYRLMSNLRQDEDGYHLRVGGVRYAIAAPEAP